MIINVIHYKPENKYTLKDFAQAAAPYENLERAEKAQTANMDRGTYELVDEINRVCDVATILERLSSRWRVESN